MPEASKAEPSQESGPSEKRALAGWSGRLGVAPRSRLEACGLLVILFILSVLAWPDVATPWHFPDSTTYLRGPAAYSSVLEWTLFAERAVAYPATLQLLGHGATLTYFQTAISLASFCGLGWLLARIPGVLVLGFLSQSSAIAPWNAAVLSESLAASFFVLTLAIGILVARSGRNAEMATRLLPSGDAAGQPSTALIAVWSVCVLFFTLLRDANVLLLPAFALPFLRSGLKVGVMVGLFLLVVGLGSTLASNHARRWEIPYNTVLLKRVAPARQAMRVFEQAGMPRLSFNEISPAVRAWMRDGGRSFYVRWLLKRASSYRVIWDPLRAADAADVFRARYFREAPRPGVLERVGNLAWSWLAPPSLLWLLLLGIPLLEYRLYGAITPAGASAALLVPLTYLAAFASYHAAGTEVARHMLIACIGYRIAVVCGLAALLPQGRRFRARQSSIAG